MRHSGLRLSLPAFSLPALVVQFVSVSTSARPHTQQGKFNCIIRYKLLPVALVFAVRYVTILLWLNFSFLVDLLDIGFILGLLWLLIEKVSVFSIITL